VSPAGLTTEMEETEGVRLIHVSGPLDSVTHDSFRDFLDPLVSQAHARIVLDCRNLTYVNSRGLALLLHYHRAAERDLSFFGIAALNSRIRKAIDLLGMGHLVTAYPTVEEAMRTAKAL